MPGRWPTGYKALMLDGVLLARKTDAEAFAHGVCSADVVLNILARQRQAGRRPAVIPTPEGMQLAPPASGRLPPLRAIAGRRPWSVIKCWR